MKKFDKLFVNKSGEYRLDKWTQIDRFLCFGFLGLLAWDVDSSHVDLNCELLNLTNSAPEGDEARNGKQRYGF